MNQKPRRGGIGHRGSRAGFAPPPPRPCRSWRSLRGLVVCGSTKMSPLTGLPHRSSYGLTSIEQLTTEVTCDMLLTW